jgi:hypothetical protein
MPVTFSDEFTSVLSQVFQQFVSFHAVTAQFFLLHSRFLLKQWASCRLNSMASWRVIRSVSTSSSRVCSWQFTPETSSIHPIHQSLCCFTIAVYWVSIQRSSFPDGLSGKVHCFLDSVFKSCYLINDRSIVWFWDCLSMLVCCLDPCLPCHQYFPQCFFQGMSQKQNNASKLVYCNIP